MMIIYCSVTAHLCVSYMSSCITPPLTFPPQPVTHELGSPVTEVGLSWFTVADLQARTDGWRECSTPRSPRRQSTSAAATAAEEEQTWSGESFDFLPRQPGYSSYCGIATTRQANQGSNHSSKTSWNHAQYVKCDNA